MPSLKQLTCTIQWGPTNIPFTEYGKMYGDGVVESFICVPSNTPQSFAVHLCSKGFIYDGLAMVVFIDGQYHVNRNRTNLIPPESLPNDRARDADSAAAIRRRTEVEFLVRQKEKSHGDGLYMGRSWRFDNHNIGESGVVFTNWRLLRSFKSRRFQRIVQTRDISIVTSTSST